MTIFDKHKPSSMKTIQDENVVANEFLISEFPIKHMSKNDWRRNLTLSKKKTKTFISFEELVDALENRRRRTDPLNIVKHNRGNSEDLILVTFNHFSIKEF